MMPPSSASRRLTHAVYPRGLLDLDDLADGYVQITNQKMPERLVLVEELPGTASGKVQKFKLREQITRVLLSEQS